MNTGTVILMYHKISENSAHAAHMHCVLADSFKKQMAYLKKSGYEVLSWEEIASNSMIGSGARIGLTFDDGNASDIESANILKSLGYSALFFVPTEYIGQTDHLRRKDIFDLHQLGMGIGSHSHRHVQLTAFNDAEAEKELKKSKEILEEIVQRPVEHFSFPGGAYNARILSIANTVGYKYFYTSDWGINTPRQFSTRVLRRIPILYNFQINDFENTLQLRNYYAKLILFHSKELMKKALGKQLYVKLRQVSVNMHR